MRQRVVAMKKRSDATQEFWAEVSVIGRINKMNLVRMCGFRSEHQHRLLVYEHVENQSLDMHLFFFKRYDPRDISNCIGHCQGARLSPPRVFRMDHTL